MSANLEDTLATVLGELGPWSSEDGVRFVEVAGFRAVLEPLDGEDPDDATDALLTVRAEGGAAQPQLDLELRSTEGDVRRGVATRAGQVRFADVGETEWEVRPLAASGGVVIDLTRFRRIDRVLPAAAAAGTRRVGASFTSEDGRVVTDVDETPEGRLVVTVTADPSAADDENVGDAIAVVRLRWSLLAPEVVRRVHTLVVPIGARRVGEPLVTRYDLGPVDHAEAVDIEPAELVDESDVTPEAAEEALLAVPHGAAVRAWRRFLESNTCPPEVRTVVERALADAL